MEEQPEQGIMQILHLSYAAPSNIHCQKTLELVEGIVVPGNHVLLINNWLANSSRSFVNVLCVSYVNIVHVKLEHLCDNHLVEGSMNEERWATSTCAIPS